MEKINNFFIITIDFKNSAFDTICYNKNEVIDNIASLKKQQGNLDNYTIIIEKKKVKNDNIFDNISEKREFEQLLFDGDEEVLNSIVTQEKITID